MELYQLRSFAVVAEEGHLTRASQRLNASQSTVSAQIKALEEEFGVSLFHRRPKGMVLTEAGQRLLAQARQVLDAADTLGREARALGEQLTGVLRVGVNTDAQYLRATTLAERLHETHPGLACAFMESQSWRAAKQLLASELDGAYYYGRFDDPKVRERTVRNVRLVAFAGGELGRRLKGAGWEALLAHPWIQTMEYCPFKVACQGLFHSLGVEPKTVMATDSEDALREMACTGKGVAYLREDVAAELAASGAGVVFDVEPVELPLTFGVAAARLADPPVKALLDAVDDVWNA